MKSLMKKGSIVVLIMAIVLPLFTVNASYGTSDAIWGYVTYNGVGVSGITVKVNRVSTGLLEGEGEISGLPGTETTDSAGYFKIWKLYAHGELYRVEVETPCGTLIQTVAVYCGTPVRVDFNCVEAPGTGTPGYWKNHPEAWPVDEITIGGVTYTKEDAIALMWEKKNNDKTTTMFGSLIAAKLNVLMGNPSSCVDDVIEDADSWMATYGPVLSGVKANSDAWKEGEPLYLILDDYNNGLLCAPPRD